MLNCYLALWIFIKYYQQNIMSIKVHIEKENTDLFVPLRSFFSATLA